MPRVGASAVDATPALVGSGWILDANKDLDPVAARQAKRAYHRDHMVAFRQRKKESLASMKETHKKLEAQLAYQLAQRRALMLSGLTDLLTDELIGNQAEELSQAERLQRLQEAFCNLVDEAELRRAETKRLQEEIEHFIKLKLLLHYELGLLKILDDAGSNQESNDDREDEDHRPIELRGFFIYFDENEPPFYFEPFTKEECDAFTREGYKGVRVLQDAFNKGELGVRETYCMGWRAQRSLERLYLQDGSEGPLFSRVRFTKRVRSPDGEAAALVNNLATFAYNALSSAEQYSRIQRTRFVSHTLQTLGDKHQISIRNAPDPSGSTDVRYLHQLTRVDDQYSSQDGKRRGLVRSTVLMLAVDTPRHALLREMMNRSDVFWITEGTAFISFIQIDDSNVEIDYGNFTKCLSDEQAQYFMIELGAQLIRWENLVIPPRLLRF